jgi:hypothetical protein
VLLVFPSFPDRPEDAGAHVKRARRIARTGLGGRCASLQSAKCKTMINTAMYFVYLYVHHWHPKLDSPFSHWQFPKKGGLLRVDVAQLAAHGEPRNSGCRNRRTTAADTSGQWRWARVPCTVFSALSFRRN